MSWIVPYLPRPEARFSLVCIPHAGAGAMEFCRWPGLLPHTFEVYGVELPGRGRRLGEPAHGVLADLAERLFDAIQSLPSRPLILFGHSMGAILAFEVARRFQARRVGMLARLCVSGAAPPQTLGQRKSQLHHLPREEFLAAVGALAGTPEELLRNEEFVTLFEPTLRADFQALETYQYAQHEQLHVPISVFGGESDVAASPSRLAAWSELTTKSCVMRILPGDHFFLRAQAAAVLFNIVECCR